MVELPVLRAQLRQARAVIAALEVRLDEQVEVERRIMADIREQQQRMR